MRGAAELRSIGPVFAREGEAAFSIEWPWQSHGVGTVLLERTLLSARNRGIKLLRMHCLADNRRMQQLARKFEADLKFDFGSVVGEVDPPRFTLAVVDAREQSPMPTVSRPPSSTYSPGCSIRRDVRC